MGSMAQRYISLHARPDSCTITSLKAHSDLRVNCASDTLSTTFLRVLAKAKIVSPRKGTSGRCRYPFHRHIHRRLRQDGLVSDALYSKLKKVAKTSCCPRNSSVFLHSLHQVFPIDFSVRSFRFFVVGDSTYRNIDIRFPFETHAGAHKKGSPYTSKGLVRFELSTLPEHAGTRTVVMRVVKLLGDLGPYLGEDRPLEGALVLRHNPARKSKLFCLDSDRDSPDYAHKNFSHPDALPLLLANTFGAQAPRSLWCLAHSTHDVFVHCG